MIQCRDFSLKSDCLLGPMAGVTDYAYRKVLREMVPDVLLVTEMVSLKGFFYAPEKTAPLLRTDADGHPVALQVFGSEPEVVRAVMPRLNALPHDLIDINMGCPAPKIVRNGDGSALMRNREAAARFIEAVVTASTKPVTLKMRKGWDEDSVNAVEIGRLAESLGVQLVTVHGRTREQFYSGQADWSIFKEVKSALSIPVIGNGDIFSVEDAIRMRKETGVDGVMAARGVQGNPWLLKRIDHYFKTGEMAPLPTAEEKIRVARRHFDLLLEDKGDHIGVLEMRKHAAWYLKGIRGSAAAKRKIFAAQSPEEVIEALDACLS